jgi:ribose 5-phosphate isomerase A
MVEEVGRRLRSGQLGHITAIPTSAATAQQARQLNIPLTTLEKRPHIDLTIDGADEIDPQLDLIKGLGGALLREKIVAAASARLIIIADERKIVQHLGTRSPLPVEVIPFAERPVAIFLRGLGARLAVRRENGQNFITDEGNIIMDCHFARLDDPYQLAQQIIAQPGVVEHGFFLGLATEAIVATPAGLKKLKRD